MSHSRLYSHYYQHYTLCYWYLCSKKFQSWKDKRLRVCEEGRDGLDMALHEGKLHEALLDRREKMKADRYCK